VRVARASRWLILLAVATTSLGCAGGGWSQMKTKRFTGYSDVPRDHRDTLEQLELAHATLATFFPKAEIGPVEVLFLTAEDFLHTFGAERGGALVLPKVPGGGRLGTGNTMVLVQDIGYPASTMELSHLFLHKVVPNAPLWLHEGLAMYFAQSRVGSSDGKWLACYGADRQAVQIIRQPLDKFFTIGWKDYASSEPGYYRGTGLLLMDFLFHGDKGAQLQKLPGVFAAAAQGAPGPQIMSVTFPGMNLEQLGQRIYDFKSSDGETRQRNLMCPLPIPVIADKLPDESSPQETPANHQEIEQLMQALKQLPRGDRMPSWYPPEIVGG
jgi:hypothetical protein